MVSVYWSPCEGAAVIVWHPLWAECLGSEVECEEEATVDTGHWPAVSVAGAGEVGEM